MKTALVTGGAGFIGSALVRELVKKGIRVRVYDDFSSGKEENLKGLDGDIQIVRGCITKPALFKAMEGVDLVFHLAAVASVSRSFSEPFHCHRINLEGSLAVMESARKVGVGRLVQAVSAAAYGSNTNIPLSESEAPAPLSPYGLHKVGAEMYAKIYAEEYGLETVSLRFFNVFGPRQDPNGEYAAVVPKFVDRMIRGKRPIIFGRGTQTRDFVFVEDVARALVMASQSDNPKLIGEVVNVAAGRETSLLDLASAINACMNTDLEPEFQDARPGDIERSIADTTKASELMGFEATTGLQEGLMSIVTDIS